MIYPLPNVKRRVLIAEDEENLVRALQDNLEAEGYGVDVAYNGEEAVEHLRNQMPDLILLDLLMPKKDGFYVLEEVKKSSEFKRIPVLVLSNLEGDAEIKRALEIGADDYCVKSQHSMEEIIEKIKKYLGAGARMGLAESGIVKPKKSNGNLQGKKRAGENNQCRESGNQVASAEKGRRRLLPRSGRKPKER